MDSFQDQFLGTVFRVSFQGQFLEKLSLGSFPGQFLGIIFKGVLRNGNIIVFVEL